MTGPAVDVNRWSCAGVPRNLEANRRKPESLVKEAQTVRDPFLLRCIAIWSPLLCRRHINYGYNCHKVAYEVRKVLRNALSVSACSVGSQRSTPNLPQAFLCEVTFFSIYHHKYDFQINKFSVLWVHLDAWCWVLVRNGQQWLLPPMWFTLSKVKQIWTSIVYASEQPHRPLEDSCMVMEAPRS